MAQTPGVRSRAEIFRTKGVNRHHLARVPHGTRRSHGRPQPAWVCGSAGGFQPRSMPPLATPVPAPPSSARSGHVSTSSTCAEVMFPSAAPTAAADAAVGAAWAAGTTAMLGLETELVLTAVSDAVHGLLDPASSLTITPPVMLTIPVPPEATSSAGSNAVGPATSAPFDAAAPQLLHGALALAAGVWRAYGAALEEHPLASKAAAAAGGLDVLRVLRQGSYGCLDGPIGHVWYGLLDKHVCPEEPKALRAVVGKTAADQLLMSPIMTCVFFAYLNLLQGTPADIVPTIHARLLPTLVANYVFWVPVHCVNFRYVPSRFRIPYNSLLCIVWTTYLSWASHHCSAPGGGGGGHLG